MGVAARRFTFGFFILVLSWTAILLSACSPDSIENRPISPSETISVQQATMIAAPQLTIQAVTPIESLSVTPTTVLMSTRTAPVKTIASQINMQYPDTLLLITNFGHELKLIEAKTGNERSLFQDRIWANFVEWQDNGCKLVVRNEFGDYQLVTLKGELVTTLFSFSDLQKLGVDPYGNEVSFSPKRDWMWYWSVSGRPYDEMGPDSRYEIQDIYTISGDLRTGPYKITKNGGGWLADWSSDGKQIAFTDYDAKKIAQVFVTTAMGEDEVQLTNFGHPSTFDVLGTDVTLVDWSPEGNHLAINYSYFLKERRQFATIIIDTKLPQTEFELINSRFLWWIDRSSFLLETETDNGKTIVYRQYVGAPEIGPSLVISEFPNFGQLRPFVVPDMAGFFAFEKDWQFYVFDSSTGSVTAFPWIGLPLDILEWDATPVTFPGKEECVK